jgi:hypothetical protein
MLEVMLRVHTVSSDMSRLCRLLLLLLLLLLLIEIGHLLGKRRVRLCCSLCHRVIHHWLRWQTTRKAARDGRMEVQWVLRLHCKVVVRECILTSHSASRVEFEKTIQKVQG